MTDPAALAFAQEDTDVLTVRLSGEWRRANNPPEGSAVEERLASSPQVRRIVLSTESLTGWDSMLLTFLTGVRILASKNNVTVQETHLPEGVTRLLALASATRDRTRVVAPSAPRVIILERVGEAALAFWRSLLDTTDFLGRFLVALVGLVRGTAAFRRSDMLLVVQQCGAQALPIVSLISVLIGLILAFIAAIQLKLFGAEIYVAGIVGIGMVRALGPIMTAIILAGRTGASFAAQLGTMQVNEEIDALRTLGISPMEFLVLPRMLALFLMMPLLCLYADFMGMLGGLAIGALMLDLNVMQYCTQTRESVHLNDVWVGLISAAVFGVLVALSGCMRGMQCGRTAAAVGDATTSAVVTSIVGIIVAMALITAVCHVLNV
ncbi:MAG TPA: ABC transporter permease [Gemmatimonadales bacterium]|nr:ABC transporter permease [Gemmatimonadales bacterium]